MLMVTCYSIYRYGDDLNPWGDLITMARAWCLVKPGGLAVVGMPVGPDLIEFNAHRIYGPVQLPHFFANWEQVYTETDITENYGKKCSFCYQPLFIMRKPFL